MCVPVCCYLKLEATKWYQSDTNSISASSALNFFRHRVEASEVTHHGKAANPGRFERILLKQQHSKETGKMIHDPTHQLADTL